jgi:tRNA-specific 2-thiouridylase
MTIAVAVSGGMDSLLSLALTVDEARKVGAEVFAVHARFLGETDEGMIAALERQCEGLGVSLHVIDLVEAFEERVIRPFVADYIAGRTPNPCALCNPEMKFGLLFDAARDLGAEALATGHYAQLLPHDRYGTALLRGRDLSRDQSYFLSLVPMERLKESRFPLGNVYKKDLPEMLKARGLTPPLPKESREICFIPGDDYCAWLEERSEPLPGPGPIKLETGRVLGRHKGLWRYTLGQRRGMGVAWSEPLYVVGKDLEENALLAGSQEALMSDRCRAGQVNILVEPQLWPPRLLAQVRYRQKARPATASLDGPRLMIHFDEAGEPGAPGQIAALYDEDGVVLAAGVIES